jgi:hypothetical protein
MYLQACQPVEEGMDICMCFNGNHPFRIGKTGRLFQPDMAG